MSAVADAPPDVALFRGRRGRLAVVHLRGPAPRGPEAFAAADHALVLRPRWLVLDLSEASERWDGHHVVRTLGERLTAAGVRLALAGVHPRSVRPPEAGGGHGCPTFPTVPLAPGTLGAL